VKGGRLPTFILEVSACVFCAGVGSFLCNKLCACLSTFSLSAMWVYGIKEGDCTNKEKVLSSIIKNQGINEK